MSSPLELLQEFERELTYRGVDYRKSQFQSLRTAIEAQAAELEQARALIGHVLVLAERNPMPEQTKDTYRSGFDVGYALALQHAADHLQPGRIKREAKVGE